MELFPGQRAPHKSGIHMSIFVMVLSPHRFRMRGFTRHQPCPSLTGFKSSGMHYPLSKSIDS
jgi:hypothetical protein